MRLIIDVILVKDPSIDVFSLPLSDLMVVLPILEIFFHGLITLTVEFSYSF